MERAPIYILRCADDSPYAGITRRGVEERVSEHNAGLIEGFTHGRLPAELLVSEHYSHIDEAVADERRIKGWSRAKKTAYFRGDSKPCRFLPVRGPGPYRHAIPRSFDKLKDEGLFVPETQ